MRQKNDREVPQLFCNVNMSSDNTSTNDRSNEIQLEKLSLQDDSSVPNNFSTPTSTFYLSELFVFNATNSTTKPTAEEILTVLREALKDDLTDKLVGTKEFSAGTSVRFNCEIESLRGVTRIYTESNSYYCRYTPDVNIRGFKMDFQIYGNVSVTTEDHVEKFAKILMRTPYWDFYMNRMLSKNYIVRSGGFSIVFKRLPKGFAGIRQVKVQNMKINIHWPYKGKCTFCNRFGHNQTQCTFTEEEAKSDTNPVENFEEDIKEAEDDVNTNK